jgi:hypothetical protein
MSSTEVIGRKRERKREREHVENVVDQFTRSWLARDEADTGDYQFFAALIDLVELERADAKAGAFAPPSSPEEKGYLKNCFVKPRSDETGHLFYADDYGRLIATLDGYAIVPCAEFEALQVAASKVKP